MFLLAGSVVPSFNIYHLIPPALSFLPVCEDFDVKRDKARQRFRALSEIQFKNFCGDIFYEMCRRYPNFAEVSIIYDLHYAH